MGANPVVRDLGESMPGVRHFRIEGGDIVPPWKVRAGQVAWCEFGVDERGRLTSFGGEVWPMAWPHLFENIPGARRAGIRVTPEGAALLGLPCLTCHGEGSYDAGDIDGVAGERFCDECEKGQALSDGAYAYHHRSYYPGAGRSLESIEQELREIGETNKANMIAAQRGAR